MTLNNKSEIFERIEQLSISKGFKNISDFSYYVGFPAPEKLYRLGRSPKNKPSFDMLVQISNTFEDLNLNWLIKGVGAMTMTPREGEFQETRTETGTTDAVADSITKLIQTISDTNDTALRENIELLKQELHGISESEKEIKEKVDYIYKVLLRAELSEDIQKTINKIKEKE